MLEDFDIQSLSSIRVMRRIHLAVSNGLNFGALTGMEKEAEKAFRKTDKRLSKHVTATKDRQDGCIFLYYLKWSRPGAPGKRLYSKMIEGLLGDAIYLKTLVIRFKTINNNMQVGGL